MCTSSLAMQIPDRKTNKMDQVAVIKIRSPSFLLNRFLEMYGGSFSLSHYKTFPRTSCLMDSPSSMTYIG